MSATFSGELHLGIFAARQIAAAEELSYDYNVRRSASRVAVCVLNSSHARHFSDI